MKKPIKSKTFQISLILYELNLRRKISIYVVLIKMPFDISLTVSGAFSPIKLLAIESPLPKNLINSFATSRRSRTCIFLHRIYVWIVHLIIIYPWISTFDRAAFDVMIAEPIMCRFHIDLQWWMLRHHVYHALIYDHITVLCQIIFLLWSCTIALEAAAALFCY